MSIDAFVWTSGGQLLTPELSELGKYVADEKAVVWLNTGPQTPRAEELLTSAFGLHPLNVEDVFLESQPKLEETPKYLYLILQVVDPARNKPRDLHTVELDVILGDNFLVTHADQDLNCLTRVWAMVQENPELLSRGPDFVAHAVIDALIDEYPPLMMEFQTTIDLLELEVLKQPRPELMEQIFELKHSLQRIRRLSTHQTDALKRLSAGESPRIDPELIPFFRDVYDHFVRSMDLAESFRSLVGATLDAYLSMQSHRMNEVMHLLTVISTVMLPLTFITGLYGMNFSVMPELNWEYGYAATWAAMVGIAGGILIYFKKRRWL